MKLSRLWAVIPIAFIALLFGYSANARNTTFAWDAAPSWPAGTTIELQANGATASGITGTQYTIDIPVQTGAAINASVRAIPPVGYQCGNPLNLCPPSDWDSLVQTMPAIPTELWSSWTHDGAGTIMADPVFQTLGTLEYKGATNASSLSSVITDVAVGDLLLVFVQREVSHVSLE